MLVDTNVLVDVLENDPTWADWSIAQLRAQAQIHRLVINPVIYAELSLTFSTVEALDATLADLQIPVIETPKPAQFLAGKAPLCNTAAKPLSVAAQKPMCWPTSSLAHTPPWRACPCSRGMCDAMRAIFRRCV